MRTNFRTARSRSESYVMSIIVFIALLASFSLKNVPISEKIFLTLCVGIEFGTFCFATIKVLIFLEIRKSLFFYIYSLTVFLLAKLE